MLTNDNRKPCKALYWAENPLKAVITGLDGKESYPLRFLLTITAPKPSSKSVAGSGRQCR